MKSFGTCGIFRGQRLRHWLSVPLLLLIVGCGTTPSAPSSGLDRLEAQLRCPRAPVRLTERLKPPVFEESDTWDSWADKLTDWALEEAKRRADLGAWYAPCHTVEG